MIPLQDVSWDRMILAVENVRQRLARAVKALESAGIPYAVIGGNAVAAWVSRVDVAAVRNTQDVDLLIRRSDLAAADAALSTAGFIHRHVKGIDMFLDGPGAKPRDAVHVIFAGEKVRPEDAVAAPEVNQSEQTAEFSLLQLDSLVRMKLTAFRRKDQVHLLDMIDLDLIDATWCDRLPPQLADRLRHLLATPEG